MLDEKQDRTKGIGGSDAPVIVGISPYKSPIVLFYEKRGEIQADALETEAMEWGNRLEGIVADAYAEKTGRSIRRQPRKAHPAYPWMLGNIDRQIIGDKRGVGLLEVKTTNTFNMKEWESGPTDAALLQLQHYLAIYGYQWGSIAVLVGGQHFKYFDVERDDQLIEYLIQIEIKFWTRVQSNIPPDTTWDKESLTVLRRLYPLDSGQTITLDTPEAVAMADQFVGCKEVIDEMEQKVDAAKGYIQNAMQSASYAEIPGYSCSWKTSKSGVKFDEDAFAISHPDLYAQFQRERPGSRRFILRPSKGVKA